MPPCLTLSIIRYGSRVKWSNPGKGVAPSPWCSSYRKGNLRVTLDYGRQLYLFYIHIYICLFIYLFNRMGIYLRPRVSCRLITKIIRQGRNNWEIEKIHSGKCLRWDFYDFFVCMCMRVRKILLVIVSVCVCVCVWCMDLVAGLRLPPGDSCSKM